MKKRDTKKQAKLQKITTQRAKYEKARNLKKKAMITERNIAAAARNAAADNK